ncbi:hypothetical protein C8R44DRAFT_261642 [Mycena epipterygia]|nr:hypothetical protein C8R44DRAFT_261642 [Mycena epipterygia]
MACSDAHSLIQERLGSGLDSALGGFPNELLLEIIVNLGRGDLTSLCLTSRALSALACSILYTCIDLRSEASIGFFCRTLVGSESKRQTVLHLKLSGLQSTISDEISAQFSETLQLMNRLRILNIEASLVTESFLSFLREWTCESLEEVRFNISSASSQVAPFLTSFLNRHPALTRLYIVATRFPSLPGLPDIRLPKLAFFLGPVSYFRPLVVVDRKLELVTLIGYYHTGETIGAISALEHMASSESIKLHVVTLRYDAAFMHAAAHSVPHTLSLLSFNCLEMRGRFDQVYKKLHG